MCICRYPIPTDLLGLPDSRILDTKIMHCGKLFVRCFFEVFNLLKLGPIKYPIKKN